MISHFTIRKKLKKAIKDLKYDSQFERHNAINSAETFIEDVINHEFGHTLYYRKIQKEINQSPLYEAWSGVKKHMLTENQTSVYRNTWEAFRMAKKNGDIFKISCYSAKNQAEFFAECFAIYEAGVEKLPDYIHNMIKGVIEA